MKRLHIGQSLLYGLRLTRTHFKTLVPGSALYFLPELIDSLGVDRPGPAWAWGLLKAIIAFALLWHALDLADDDTRASRLAAKGGMAAHSGNFLGSVGLYWLVVLALGALALPWVCGMDLACLSAQASAIWSGQLPQGVPAWRWAAALLSLLPCGAWALYGWFHGYYVADEGQGPWQSMVSSYHAVRGAELGVTLFCLACGVLNILGLALWVVGIFFIFPITLLATTYIHLELKQQTDFRGAF